jgi:hypothetical protein
MSGTDDAPGIHARTVDLLFSCLRESKEPDCPAAVVEVAMMEIYCDQVRDLLADDPHQKLDISGLGAAQLPRFKERVPGLSWQRVDEPAEALVRRPHSLELPFQLAHGACRWRAVSIASTAIASDPILSSLVCVAILLRALPTK